MCSTANIPGTLIAPMVPGQALMGPAAPCSWVGEKGVLEGAAFAQHPQLLLSLTPMLKEKAKGPAGACTPCACTRRSPGQNARGQHLQLLKSSKVMGSYSCSPVTPQECRGLSPDSRPARKADVLSKGKSLFCSLLVAFSQPWELVLNSGLSDPVMRGWCPQHKDLATGRPAMQQGSPGELLGANRVP